MNEKIMTIKGLHKVFTSGGKSLHILKGINLDIHQGMSLGIVGASGAGKSTLLHIIGTLDKPTDGNVFYRNENLTGKNEEELAKFRNLKLGFVFQFHHLLPEFTAFENVLFPSLIAGLNNDDSNRRAMELLKRMGLYDRMGHRSSELSGGEQQRVAVARALLLKPEIILADEPTGNLDSQNSEIVMELLLELTREYGAGLVIVTHNETLVKKFNKSFRLEDGVLKEN
jgi:lipoprotein-releasing system ATP-binding protein